MITAATLGVSLLFIAGGWGAPPTADPGKEVMFEGRPLRTWLDERCNAQSIEALENSAAALRRFCAKPEEAVPALAAALADKNEFVRQAAIICLAGFCQAE